MHKHTCVCFYIGKNDLTSDMNFYFRYIPGCAASLSRSNRCRLTNHFLIQNTNSNKWEINVRCQHWLSFTYRTDILKNDHHWPICSKSKCLWLTQRNWEYLGTFQIFYWLHGKCYSPAVAIHWDTTYIKPLWS